MRKLQRMIFIVSICFILFARGVAADTNENWADMPEEIQSACKAVQNVLPPPQDIPDKNRAKSIKGCNPSALFSYP